MINKIKTTMVYRCYRTMFIIIWSILWLKLWSSPATSPVWMTWPPLQGVKVKQGPDLLCCLLVVIVVIVIVIVFVVIVLAMIIILLSVVQGETIKRVCLLSYCIRDNHENCLHRSVWSLQEQQRGKRQSTSALVKTGEEPNLKKKVNRKKLKKRQKLLVIYMRHVGENCIFGQLWAISDLQERNK